MNRMILPATLTVLFPSAAIAEVGILGRTSTLVASRIDPDPWLRWDEIASSTALGEFTLTTPHGGTFTSWASAGGIGGGLSGSSWRPYYSSPFHDSRSTSLDVVFLVTGEPVSLLLGMSGYSWPPGNVILTITDLSGTVVLFDADSIATDPGSSQGPQVWSSASWTGQLGPGSYRLSASAAANVTWGPGGGQPWSGSGTFWFDLAFVPAPPVAMAFLALGAMATRRRE